MTVPEKVLGDTQTKLLRHEQTPKDALVEAAQLVQQQLDEYWARQGR